MTARHWLVVEHNGIPDLPNGSSYEDLFADWDAEIEHPEGCDLACDVAYQMEHEGWESFEISQLRPLAPGRHEIEFWSIHYAAGPWGGDEWDSGLCLKEAE